MFAGLRPAQFRDQAAHRYLAEIVFRVVLSSEDRSLAACGTAIYRPRDEAQKYNSVDYFDFEGFNEVMRVPFVPNTLFAFVRTHNSFHGVPVIETFGKSRNLLIFESFALRPF